MTWSFNKLSITLTESLAATDFIARAVTVSSGEFTGRAKLTGSGTLPVLDARPVHVTIAPDMGDRWYSLTTYKVGDHCFPTDPATTPYYYECTVAGTSNSAEPTWPTSAGTVNDGTVVWTYVEALAQPITHGPLIPA